MFMGEYFKPLRRKIGVVTLVIVCMFVGGWVRSLSIQDGAKFHATRHQEYSLISLRSGIHCLSVRRERDYNGQPLLFTPSINWHSNKLPNNKLILDMPDFVWSWRFLDFGVRECSPPSFGSVRFKDWTAPYWSIVIPLTLLSAWLLLSMPRAKKSPA